MQLSRAQAAALEAAARDLDAARAADLAAMNPAGLITLVESLRSALHDTLGVAHALARADPL